MSSFLPKNHIALVEKSFEETADGARDTKLEQLDMTLFELKERCESPIEVLLGAYIAQSVDGYNELTFVDSVERAHGDWGTFWAPQAKIGAYRVDFLFRCVCGSKNAYVVVECDGHDFHERNKEQAARDRSRDRDLTSRGLTVVRFTGSEIYADPAKCAESLSGILFEIMDAFLITRDGFSPRKVRLT